MTTIDRFADTLAQAHRGGELIALDEELNALSVDDAPSVQLGVMQRLGETAPAGKVAINKTGRAVAAPMFGSRFIRSGAALPVAGAIGLEVEVAVRLGRDLTPELAAHGENGVLSAIDAFLVGIELIGPRVADRAQAGLGALLADNLIGNGYALNDQDPWSRGSDIEGAIVDVAIDGTPVYSAVAANPFGGVMVALEAYARAPFDGFGICRAGQIITTGTLCGLVAVSGPCRISATLDGAHQVDLELL